MPISIPKILVIATAAGGDAAAAIEVTSSDAIARLQVVRQGGLFMARILRGRSNAGFVVFPVLWSGDIGKPPKSALPHHLKIAHQ